MDRLSSSSSSTSSLIDSSSESPRKNRDAIEKHSHRHRCITPPLVTEKADSPALSNKVPGRKPPGHAMTRTARQPRIAIRTRKSQLLDLPDEILATVLQTAMQRPDLLSPNTLSDIAGIMNLAIVCKRIFGVVECALKSDPAFAYYHSISEPLAAVNLFVHDFHTRDALAQSAGDTHRCFERYKRMRSRAGFDLKSYFKTGPRYVRISLDLIHNADKYVNVLGILFNNSNFSTATRKKLYKNLRLLCIDLAGSLPTGSMNLGMGIYIENKIRVKVVLKAGLLKSIRYGAKAPAISLNLSFNPGQVLIHSLASSLAQSPALTELALRNNRLASRDILLIAQAVSNNRQLKVLDLSDNPVDAHSAKGLANMVTKNSTLTGLHLNSTKIGNLGVNLLSLALLENTTLRQLSLENAEIEDYGASTLHYALERNITLVSLRLDNNPIDSAHPVHQKAQCISTAWHQAFYDAPR